MPQQNRQKKTREKAKENAQHLIEEKEMLRLEYSALLTSLIHVNHSHHSTCYLSDFKPPVLSAILPIFDKTTVRISIGSHRETLNRGKITSHRNTLVDIIIPPQHLLLFYHEGLIHGGGPSNIPCERMFAVFGPTDFHTELQNRNYSHSLHPCEDNCPVCKVLECKRKIMGNIVLPTNIDVDKSRTQPGMILYDYTLWDDGFCVIKVIDDLKYKHLSKLHLEDFTANSKFDPIGQEEDDKTYKGKRCILNKGVYLTTDEFLSKKLNNDLHIYIERSYDTAITYLKKLTGVPYELKGHTMLLNKGNVGYQKLHMDDETKCTCIRVPQSKIN